MGLIWYVLYDVYQCFSSYRVESFRLFVHTLLLLSFVYPILDVSYIVVVFASSTIIVAIILIVTALSIESASISTAQVCKIGSSSQTITSSKRRVRQVQKLSRAGRGVWIAFVRTWAWRPPRIGIRCHEGNWKWCWHNYSTYTVFGSVYEEITMSWSSVKLF